MTLRHSELLNQVRTRVCETFAGMGVDSKDMNETILIRDGHYCGRRFQAEHGHAVWFLEENQIKVYLTDGQVLILKTDQLTGESATRAATRKVA